MLELLVPFYYTSILILLKPELPEIRENHYLKYEEHLSHQSLGRICSVRTSGDVFISGTELIISNPYSTKCINLLWQEKIRTRYREHTSFN
jgi:hypothetical protein